MAEGAALYTLPVVGWTGEVKGKEVRPQVLDVGGHAVQGVPGAGSLGTGVGQREGGGWSHTWDLQVITVPDA